MKKKYGKNFNVKICNKNFVFGISNTIFIVILMSILFVFLLILSLIFMNNFYHFSVYLILIIFFVLMLVNYLLCFFKEPGIIPRNCKEFQLPEDIKKIVEEMKENEFKINNENEDENIIINTIYTHKINLNFPENATLFDLKTQISKNFLIREEEYELFLGENSLSKVNNKKLLNEIINQFKTKEFKIKSYKNIFDLKTQLIDYNEYLEKSIKEKQKEIEKFKKDYKEILSFNE